MPKLYHQIDHDCLLPSPFHFAVQNDPLVSFTLNNFAADTASLNNPQTIYSLTRECTEGHVTYVRQFQLVKFWQSAVSQTYTSI
jgi:hypothetical protein